MLRSLKNVVVKNKDIIMNTSFGGSMLIGSGIGGYYGYTESRKYLYEECVFNTILGTFGGAYCGLITMITLPISLPVVASVTFLRYFDKDNSGIEEYGIDHIRCSKEGSE
jgi:hypothetical protein